MKNGVINPMPQLHCWIEPVLSASWFTWSYFCSSSVVCELFLRRTSGISLLSCKNMLQAHIKDRFPARIINQKGCVRTLDVHPLEVKAVLSINGILGPQCCLQLSCSTVELSSGDDLHMGRSNGCILIL